MKLRFVAGNRIDLLNSGREYFPALLAALELARQEIFLEAYIFAQDATANAVVERLCAAAARGARVQVLVDGFGARDMPEDYRRRLAASGARVLDFHRPVLWRPVRGMRRMHRKLVVIDGAAAGTGVGTAVDTPVGTTVGAANGTGTNTGMRDSTAASARTSCAFAGGINIIDDWNTPHEVPPRFDYAVRIEGPLVAQIHAAARHLWTMTAMASMRARALVRAPAMAGQPASGGTVRAALAIRDNVLHRTEIEDAYLDAIRAARSNILMACGYFLPSRHFFGALRGAALRGVTVTIIMQGPSDHPIMKAATQSLYRHLLGAGIGVVEYSKSFLHAKVAVVDDHWATVGSSNIDPFSLLLSREANVVVTDTGFARQLRASLEQAISEGGTRVTLADLARTVWYQRLAQWLAYRFARITVDLVTPNGGRNLA